MYTEFIHQTHIEIKSLIGGRCSNLELDQRGYQKDRYGRQMGRHSKHDKHALQTSFEGYKKHGLQIRNLTEHRYQIGTAVPYSTRSHYDQIAIAIVSPYNFKLPDNLQLVSEIYQIKGALDFTPVKIKIQHCSPKESLSDLCILTSSNDHPPYRFHKVDGRFHSTFAEFYVNSFSLYLIVWRKLVGIFNPSRLLYSVSLYSGPKCCLGQESYWNLRFYVGKNLYTHEDRVEKDVTKYAREWHKCASSIVQFDRDSTEIEFKPSDDKEDHLMVTDITSSFLTENTICSEQSPPCYYALRLSTKQKVQKIILKFNLKGTANDKHITYIWPCGKLGAIDTNLSQNASSIPKLVFITSSYIY